MFEPKFIYFVCRKVILLELMQLLGKQS